MASGAFGGPLKHHVQAQVPVDLKAESLLAVARQHKATHIVVAAHERRGGHIPLDQLLDLTDPVLLDLILERSQPEGDLDTPEIRAL